MTPAFLSALERYFKAVLAGRFSVKTRYIGISFMKVRISEGISNIN